MTITHEMTNSERSAVQLCAHKHLLHYGLALTRIGPPRGALLIGHLWHKAMQAVWSGYDLLTSSAFVGQAVDTIKAGPCSRFDLPDIMEAQTLVLHMLERYSRNAHQEMRKAWRTVLVENHMESRCITPSGHYSPWARYSGRCDAIAESTQTSQRAIVEHKTSSLPLESWEKDNPSAQTLGYVWLATENGLKPEGVLYNLVSTKMEPRAEDFRVIKDGKRLSRQYPANATAAGLVAAIRMHGFPVHPYADKLRELEMNPPVFERRLFKRFRLEEMKRAVLEIYHLATVARRWKTVTLPWREAAKLAGVDWKSTVVSILKKHGHKWPRSPASCTRWGRKCSFWDICTYQTEEALEGFRLRKCYHPEEE